MDEAAAVIAAHLGVVDEEAINDMSLLFFQEVLKALGRKLNYESISNLYGNSFCKDAGKHISKAFPLTKPSNVNKGWVDMINKAVSTQRKAMANGASKQDVVNKQLGDVSWAEGLLN